MKKLLISALILAVLGGVLFWSNKQEAAKEGQPDKDAPPQILALKEDSVQQIEIKPRTGESTVVKKTASGKWAITTPRALPADSAMVSSMLGTVSKLASDRVVDENAADPASYGLEPAATAVIFTLADGKTTTLKIGDPSPTNTSVYVMTDGSKRLYTMASATRDVFTKTANDLREKHILDFDQEKSSRVELTNSKGAIEFGRTGQQSEWQILKPRPMRADGWQVEDALSKLKQMTMMPNVSDKDAAAGFASASPVAKLRVTTPEGVKSLELRKGKTDAFAKVGTETYQLAKEAADGFDKTLEDFRAKKLFDFGFNDPTRIEARNEAKKIAIEKSGDKWKSAGKDMDSVSVQNLVDKLRDLAASRLVDSGFTTPTIELTVVSSEGKKTEHVQVAQAGDKFFAKRDGDATVYELNKDTVTDLRQSIDGVREPAPANDGKKK